MQAAGIWLPIIAEVRGEVGRESDFVATSKEIEKHTGPKRARTGIVTRTIIFKFTIAIKNRHERNKAGHDRNSNGGSDIGHRQNDYCIAQ